MPIGLTNSKQEYSNFRIIEKEKKNMEEREKERGRRGEKTI